MNLEIYFPLGYLLTHLYTVGAYLKIQIFKIKYRIEFVSSTNHRLQLKQRKEEENKIILSVNALVF